MYIWTRERSDQVLTPKAQLWQHRATQFGDAPTLAPLPRVTQVTFRNTGTTDPENCCINCSTFLPATGGHLNLGVGLSGLGTIPLRAANGMELAFTISGHRRGIQYDIVRTRRSSIWERRAGVWKRLESEAMGTSDDPPPDDDECLRLSKSSRLFVEDRPGWRDIVLPRPDGTTLAGMTGARTHADATDIVSRDSFAEWVIARSRSDGIPWTRLALPPVKDSTPRRFIFWHNIVWLTRDVANQWVLGPSRSEIALGSLSAAVINSPPA